MDFKKWKLTRRQLIKAGLISGAGMMLPLRFLPSKAFADPAATGLSDPAMQPKFMNPVPDALMPGFKYVPNGKNKYKVAVGPSVQMSGLVATDGVTPVPTPVFGYGDPAGGFTWPGKTFEVQRGVPIEVKWENKLLDPTTGAFLQHLLPVDTSLHWCYSLAGYTAFTIANAGIPIVSHLHGGHSDFQFDGNPEFFFSPGWGVTGPQWVEKNISTRTTNPPVTSGITITLWASPG